MKEEDLEKTIPIETIEDLEVMETRASRNNYDVSNSRSEKYKDALDSLSDEDLAEAAEEALAEKNIAMAEAILEEEKERLVKEEVEEPVNEEVPTVVSDKKVSKKNKDKVEDKDEDDEKLIDPKTAKKIKIIVIILVVLALIAIVVLIIFLNSKDDKKQQGPVPQQNTTQPETPEVPPVVVDNYYYKEGILYLLNDKEEEIGSYTCTNQDSNLCYVAFNRYADAFDVDLLINEKGDSKTQRLPIYNDNYVFIADSASKDKTNIVMYSLKENNVVENYLDVKAYSDNYVVVKNTKNKYGLIQVNDTIKEVIKPQYEYLGMVDKEKNLVAKKSGSYKIIDKTNKELSKDIDGSFNIKKYNDYLIVTEIGDSYSVQDYEGKVLASGYKYATVVDKYMALVKDKKLYVKDVDGLKYNQDGIALKNINYIKKFVYNDDNKLKETLGSFNLNVKEESVEVVVYDRTTSGGSSSQLDFNTVLVNKNYNYLNYFNGKLYFYSDLEKDNLLGSYTCINKNSISSADDKLTSCVPANDTIYEDNEVVSEESKNRKSTTPLINNKYVFIKDGDNAVYLYNLVDKKKDGSYTTVNTYTKNNDYTFDVYNGKLNVIALNQKGYYGMINIIGEVGTKVYDFEYKKMEKIGDYVLAQNQDGKWLILYGADSSSSLFPHKVVNYTKDKKYFKLRDDSKKYSVYDASGSQIGTETYKDLIMYNLYYLGISSSNQLYLYDYEGTKITNEAITISGNTCSLDGDKIKSSYKNDQYTISVCNGDKYETYVFDVKQDKFLTEDTEDDKEEDKEDSGSDTDTEKTPEKEEEKTEE